jgi:LPS export ABC transporter protein LptC
MGKLRYILLLLSVLAVAVFTRWLLTTLTPQGRQLPVEMRHVADYFVSDFHATIFDQNGKPYYKLKATHMEHFADDETVAMQFPEIEFLREAELPWTVVADSGTVYQDRDILLLKGKVTITHAAASETQRMLLLTRDLRIDLQNKIADTDAEVHVQAKSSNIEAKGMHLNLINNTLVLDANARGTYVP